MKNILMITASVATLVAERAPGIARRGGTGAESTDG